MSKPDFKDRVKHLFSEEGNNFQTAEYLKINFKATPLISYDYLFLEDGNKYSFSNDELNNKTSEEYPDKSDYAIYFEKIKKLCCRTLQESRADWKEHVRIVNINKRIKKILYKIFNTYLKEEELLSIIQFALYTNKNSKKSPRIFGFIGNQAVVYILFYDPYHEICSFKSGKD